MTSVVESARSSRGTVPATGAGVSRVTVAASTRLRIALPVKDKSRFRQSRMRRCIGIFRLGRKLQHRRALAFAKMRD